MYFYVFIFGLSPSAWNHHQDPYSIIQNPKDNPTSLIAMYVMHLQTSYPFMPTLSPMHKAMPHLHEAMSIFSWPHPLTCMTVEPPHVEPPLHLHVNHAKPTCFSLPTCPYHAPSLPPFSMLAETFHRLATCLTPFHHERPLSHLPLHRPSSSSLHHSPLPWTASSSAPTCPYTHQPHVHSQSPMKPACHHLSWERKEAAASL